MPHKRDHVTISKLLTAVTAVVLLLSAKEVETNAIGPPPGNYLYIHASRLHFVPYSVYISTVDSTPCERWSHLHTYLMCHEGAISTITHVHFEKKQCIQLLDNTVVTKHFMFFTRHQPRRSMNNIPRPSLMSCNHAVVVLKLLMLSGDVETNPGPPGNTS